MNNSFLQEIASSNAALQQSRSKPIQVETPDTSLSFLKSLVNESPTNDIVDKEKPTTDETDHVSFDVPLLIRLLEHARFGIESDVELHHLVERIISIRQKGILTMDDYAVISGGDIEGTSLELAPQTIASDRQDEALMDIKKLAGL